MMNYHEMEEMDLKLNLLKGNPLKIGNLIVEPFSLQEVVDYGYRNYMTNIQLMTTSLDDFVKSVMDFDKRAYLEQEKHKLTSFDFFMHLGGADLKYILFHILSMIFRTNDIKELDANTIAINFEEKGILVQSGENYWVDEEVLEAIEDEEVTLVNKDNFNHLVKIIKYQNYLENVTKKKNKKYNPADEATREFVERLEAMNAKVEEKKKAKKRAEGSDEEPADFYDIIDSVTEKSNSINIFNVWDLTMYGLYTRYARLEAIDSYGFSLRAMLAGAKDVDYKHWSSKI